MEGSFADAANNHGFKRARWRRLWRQRIQDYMIATVQNVRILLRHGANKPAAAAAAMDARLQALLSPVKAILKLQGCLYGNSDSIAATYLKRMYHNPMLC